MDRLPLLVSKKVIAMLVRCRYPFIPAFIRTELILVRRQQTSTLSAFLIRRSNLTPLVFLIA